MTIENQGFRPWERRGLRGLIASGGPASSFSHQAVRALTNGEILALPTTAIEIVPAPGEHRMALVHQATLVPTFPLPYTNAEPTVAYLALQQGESLVTKTLQNNAPTWSDLTAFLTGAHIAYLQPSENFDADLARAIASLRAKNEANIATTLYCYRNEGGDFEGGSRSNALRVTVEFRVLNILTGRFLTTVESRWNEATRTFDAA